MWSFTRAWQLEPPNQPSRTRSHSVGTQGQSSVQALSILVVTIASSSRMSQTSPLASRPAASRRKLHRIAKWLNMQPATPHLPSTFGYAAGLKPRERTASKCGSSFAAPMSTARSLCTVKLRWPGVAVTLRRNCRSCSSIQARRRESRSRLMYTARLILGAASWRLGLTLLAQRSSCTSAEAAWHWAKRSRAEGAQVLAGEISPLLRTSCSCACGTAVAVVVEVVVVV
mmetsp:Transcript_85151/g.189253  ORF Transcript_85151/g.189253 Transcript_85151/m.189253 type:complete len:228 (+) Transcript_85151:277-960(+)